MITNLKINKKVISTFLAFQLALVPYVSKSNNFYSNNSQSIKILEEALDDNENEILFDEYLKKTAVISQEDSRWSRWKYNKICLNGNIGDGGCKPVSMTNALILTFNLNDEEMIKEILKNSMACDNINAYLLGKDKYHSYIGYDNFLASIDNNILFGNTAKDISSQIEYLDNDHYMIGKIQFSKNNYSLILDTLYMLYQNNLDTNVIFYAMTGGYLSLERPFGSISQNGHYITMLINVKEFFENNTLYIIDSIARNIYGEDYHRLDYNFVIKASSGKLKKFNDTYHIYRINENILKLQKDDFITEKDIDLLGLQGACNVIISPNNIAKEKIKTK